MTRSQSRGRHWWRELVWQTWSDADYAWQAEREVATLLYETEMAEWEESHPRPLFRDFLVGLKGAGR